MEVDTIIEQIVAHPHMDRPVHVETRRAVLDRFPYAVYFRVAGDEIVVLAVHGRQHPKQWTSRRWIAARP